MTGLRGVFFLNEQVGWVVGGAGALLLTQDGGRTWQPKDHPSADTLWDIYFTDEMTGWILAERSIYKLRTKEEQRSYLLHTDNGGATWTRVNIKGLDPDVLLTRLIFPGANTGYVLGESGTLFTTRDAGLTWTRLKAPVNRLLSDGFFYSDDDGWIIGPGATLLRTNDGGQSWNLYSLPAVLAHARLNAITFKGPQRGWIVGSNGLILDTADGGKTWRAQNSPNGEDLFDVKFISQQEGWAVGNNGTILHTTDGGTQWLTERTDTKHPLARLAFAPRSRRGYTVGFGGTILVNESITATNTQRNNQ